MADGGVDIDLYADVEQEFPNDELNENTDLYDDVLTAGKKVIFILYLSLFMFWWHIFITKVVQQQ